MAESELRLSITAAQQAESSHADEMAKVCTGRDARDGEGRRCKRAFQVYVFWRGGGKGQTDIQAVSLTSPPSCVAAAAVQVEGDVKRVLAERRELVHKFQQIEVVEDAVRDLYIQMKVRGAGLQAQLLQT